MVERLSSLADIVQIESKPLRERITDETIYGMVRDRAVKGGAKPAVTFQLKGDPKAKAFTWSYTDLLAEVTRAANLFRSLGAHGKDSVALLLPNLPEALSASYGAMAGGIVNPINPLLEPEVIAGILNDSDAKVLVTLKSFPKVEIAQNAAEALTMAPGVTHVIEIDMLKYLTPPLKWIVPLIRPKNPVSHSATVLDWDTAIAAQPSDRLTFEEPEGGWDRVAAYFHTGGTTGDPKLAQHHIGGMLLMGETVSTGILEEGSEVLLCAIPLFHCFGAYCLGVASPYTSNHLVLMTPAGFRGEGVIDNWWSLVERYRATFFMSVPTALAALNQRDLNGADVSSLKYSICGSAPLPLELFRSFEEKTKIRILEGYGQTEATVICSVNPPTGERKVGSVGYRIPYSDLRAIITEDDEFSRFCDVDEIGELCMHGPHVFPGYKEEHKNATVFVTDPEGRKWLRSGDLGRVDAENYVWITGRAKDLIIRGGHNIDPGLIEEVLATHPAVGFAGAIGQPDAYSGELPCAYVELKEGASATAEEIKAFAAEHVGERAARPVHIAIMDELPKTAVGKIFKPDLRKEAINRVLTAALEKGGVSASITVEKDKLRGLVAEISPEAGADAEKKCAEVLDQFAVPWRLASAGDDAS